MGDDLSATLQSTDDIPLFHSVSKGNQKGFINSLNPSKNTGKIMTPAEGAERGFIETVERQGGNFSRGGYSGFSNDEMLNLTQNSAILQGDEVTKVLARNSTFPDFAADDIARASLPGAYGKSNRMDLYSNLLNTGVGGGSKNFGTISFLGGRPATHYGNMGIMTSSKNSKNLLNLSQEVQKTPAFNFSDDGLLQGIKMPTSKGRPWYLEDSGIDDAMKQQLDDAGAISFGSDDLNYLDDTFGANPSNSNIMSGDDLPMASTDNLPNDMTDMFNSRKNNIMGQIEDMGFDMEL